MTESRELATARVCLADAEAAFASPEGVARLADGLGRLADLIETGSGAEARVASNLAASYASRFYSRVQKELEHALKLPEPELEHYFNVVLAFDQVAGALPEAAAELKIRVVEALVER